MAGVDWRPLLACVGLVVFLIGVLVLFTVALDKGWVNDTGDDNGQGPSLN